MLICHFCEVLFYTVKGRRRVYVVETVYIICSQPYPNRHLKQIIQIFHPRHPVLMYISSPRQVYSTEKLRRRNCHFSRYFHDSTNRSKVALIFTGDSVLNKALAEQVISSWIFDVFIIWVAIFIIQPAFALSFPLCVPHPPANCINIPHFRLIYQSVLQRIFGMLSRHSWEQLLQQSPHPCMQPLHPALRSSSVLSLQDTSRYSHLESGIYDC